MLLVENGILITPSVPGPGPEHALDATEWARAGTAPALWMLLPLLVGLWRITRDEIR